MRASTRLRVGACGSSRRTLRNAPDPVSRSCGAQERSWRRAMIVRDSRGPLMRVYHTRDASGLLTNLEDLRHDVPFGRTLFDSQGGLQAYRAEMGLSWRADRARAPARTWTQRTGSASTRPEMPRLHQPSCAVVGMFVARCWPPCRTTRGLAVREGVEAVGGVGHEVLCGSTLEWIGFEQVDDDNRRRPRFSRAWTAPRASRSTILSRLRRPKRSPAIALVGGAAR